MPWIQYHTALQERDHMKKTAFILTAVLALSLSSVSVRAEQINFEAKEYYNAITSDMSWYSEDLDSLSLVDLTGDGIPEFIASYVSDKDSYKTSDTSGSDVIRQSRTFRKFYTVSDTKLVYLGAMTLSADTLYPYEDNGVIRWVYSDCDMVEYGSGEYFMTRDYGYISVSDSRIKRNIKFHASEEVDVAANVFSYIYKSPDFLRRKHYKDYEKNSSVYIDEANSVSDKWYTEAEKWEQAIFPDGLPRGAVLDRKATSAVNEEHARSLLYELINEYVAGEK